MNILIIGDSHTAQISKSLNIKSIPEGLKVSTITASNPIITKLKIRDGFLYLAPNNTSWGHKTISDDKLAVMYDITSQMIFNEQGNERLDLSVYDSIIVYGGQLIGHDMWVRYTQTDKYSEALLVSLCEDLISNSQHVRIIREIKQSNLTDFRLISMNEPLVNELWEAYLNKIPETANFSSVINIFKQALSNIGSEFIPLPDSLLSGCGRATNQLYKTPRDNDFAHLNSEGGDLVTDFIFNLFDPK